MKQNRLLEAKVQLERHLEYIETHFPNDDDNWNIANGYAGEIDHKFGDLSGAETKYRRTFQYFSDRLSIGHPKVHISLEHLLRVGIASNDVSKTLESMEQLETSDRELLYQNIDGAEHIKEEIGRYLRQTSHLFAVSL